MEETIFDKILAKQLPANIVYEDEHVLAFKDINPHAPVHVLVIPKVKAQSIDDYGTMDPEVAGHYFTSIPKVAQKLGLSAGGYRVVFNHGHHGQQTVSYVHAHLLGGRQLQWPPG